MARVLSVGLLAACTTTAPDEDALTETPDLGWATTIVEEPETFSTLMEETSRDGWVAVHRHDYGAAWGHFRSGAPSPEATASAYVPHQDVYADLQRVSTLATERLVTTWRQRGTLGDDTAAGLVLAGARACGMQAEATVASSPRRLDATVDAGVISGLSEEDAKVVRAIAGWDDRGWDEVGSPHLALVDGSGVQSLLERAESGTEVRRWSHPCRPYQGLYTVNKGGGPVPDGSTLAGTLFSARGVDVTRLGLPDGVPDTDDAQAAKEEVRAMDAILDATRARLEKTADPDGLALLQQLEPLARLRQEVLVERARRDLRAGHTQRAYATLLLARDVTERGIGVANGPALFALLAEANLRAGRSREALDALQPLVAVLPEAAATREIVSDLVVLEGMDRTGDSKEH